MAYGDLTAFGPLTFQAIAMGSGVVAKNVTKHEVTLSWRSERAVKARKVYDFLYFSPGNTTHFLFSLRYTSILLVTRFTYRWFVNPPGK